MRAISGVFVVAAALSLPSAAPADVPAGFSAQTALATRVAFITAKPVAVYCASSDVSWNAEEQTRTNGAVDVLGHAVVAGTEIFLSPTVCAPLLAKLHGRRVSLLVFGAALEVLAHESEHIAGHAGEGDAECTALTVVPRLARTGFGIRKSATMQQVVYGAYARHHAAIADPAYRGPCDG